MILLLGASGFVGQAFAAELQRRDLAFTPVTRRVVDYTRFDSLLDLVRVTKPTFLINAAGYGGRPNVDSSEVARAETLQANTLLPLTLAQACQVASLPWGHVSSGCIYAGAWITEDGSRRLEPDLNRPKIRALIESQPAVVQGFTETDEPNFTFRRPPCSFYSGTKALAEESIRDLGQSYLWRLRIPFDEIDQPRNFLTKVQQYPKVYDNVNSFSHRGDFVRACLDLWERRAPFGIYNVTNPGFITTRRVVTLIEQQLRPRRDFAFWSGDEEFYRLGAKAPRSNCVLDVAKLLATGVALRPIEEALLDALKHWAPHNGPAD